MAHKVFPQKAFWHKWVRESRLDTSGFGSVLSLSAVLSNYQIGFKYEEEKSSRHQQQKEAEKVCIAQEDKFKLAQVRATTKKSVGKRGGSNSSSC